MRVKPASHSLESNVTNAATTWLGDGADDAARPLASPVEPSTKVLHHLAEGQPGGGSRYRFDEFELDVASLELRKGAVPVRADPIVLRLLMELILSPGQLVTKEQLLARIWDNRAISENVISVAVARLRKTLGHEKGRREFVVSVHGLGYRFVRRVTPVGVASHRGAQAIPLRGLPFVGRESSLRKLREAFDCAQARVGSICLLTGEAGIGKTSLVEVFEAEVARVAGATVAWGQCRETGDTPPLWPFVQLVRDALSRAPSTAVTRELSAAVEALDRELPEVLSVPRREQADFDQSDSFASHQMFDALLRVIVALARSSPCVFVIDDLHRADAGTLELLRCLVDEVARTPVLLVGMLRSEVVRAPASAQLSYVLGHRNTLRLRLECLDELEVAMYVQRFLGRRDDAFARVIYEKSEGNPFFMCECSKLLRDTADPAGVLLTVPSAALDLPRQWVAAIAPVARNVLAAAAIIGATFDLSLLGEATKLPHDVVMLSLDEGVRLEVIAPIAGSRTAFRFRHDLLRVPLSELLTPVERRSLHLRITDSLERRRESGTAVAPADLASHAYAAMPHGDPMRVVEHCHVAAITAARRQAFGDALRYVRQAQEALELHGDPNVGLKFALLLQQAWLAKASSSPDFEQTLRETLVLGRELGQRWVIAGTALMFHLHAGFPALRGARAVLEEARDALGDDELRAAVVARLVTIAPTAYDCDRVSSELAWARELAAQTDSLPTRYNVLAAELYSCGGPKHRGRSSEVLGELDALCAAHGRKLAITPVLLDLHRAIVEAQCGNRAGSAVAIERAMARARRIGHRELGWHAERFKLVALADEGKDVRVELRDLHRRAARESLFGTDLFIAFDEIVVLGEGHDWREALAPDGEDGPNLWAMKVRALSAGKRYDDARAALHRVAPDNLARLPQDRDYLGTLGALTRAAMVLREVRYLSVLERLLAEHRGSFSINVAFVQEGSVDDLLQAIVDEKRKLPERSVLG